MLKIFKWLQNRKLKKLLNKELDNNIADIHKYIADLKEFDFGIVRTIIQLCEKLKIHIPESKELVLNSPSWMNEKEKFIDFNNRMCEIMEQEADKIDNNVDGAVSLTFDFTKDDKK